MTGAGASDRPGTGKADGGRSLNSPGSAAQARELLILKHVPRGAAPSVCLACPLRTSFLHPVHSVDGDTL